MIKQSAYLFACLLLILCLVGCAPQPTGQSSSALAPAAGEAGDVKPCTNATEDGIYLLVSVFPNARNIVYLDFATQQQVFLCNRPECTHNHTNCTSYLPADQGQEISSIAVCKEGVLLLQTAASEAALPSISMMDFDGSNRRVLFELGAHEMISGKLFQDDSFCYFEQYTTDKETLTQTQTLVRASLEDGSMETLYTYAAGETSHLLLDAYDNKIVLDSIFADGDKQGRGFSWFNLEASAAGGQVISKPFYFYLMEEESAFFDNGFICSLHYGDQTIHCLDVQTQEETVLDCAAIDLTRASDCYLLPGFDQWLCFKVLSENPQGGIDTRQYLVHTQTGEIIESTLRDGYLKKPLYIESEYNDFLCVISDFSDTTFISEFDGETQVQTAWREVYALIKKEDYLNNAPSYKVIENAAL